MALCLTGPSLAAEIGLAGVFPGKALLTVNGGVPRTVAVGARTEEGVLVVSVERETATVEVDGKRLKQVIFNLVGNAIKFTDRGQVRLLIDALPPAAPGGMALMRLRIIDTGIGMDAATLGRLFQRFSQGDDSISRRFGGTGLGLEISRELVRMMGGDIRVDSQPGQGSTFSVLLPLLRLESPVAEAAAPVVGGARIDAAAPAPGADTGTGALEVLVADDHPVNRKYMQVLMERLGHRVSLALDGREALEQVRQREASPFDLVLMDVHMPNMDGLASTRAIRLLPQPGGATRIIALTADAFAESRDRARSAGMDDFLAKPVQVHDVEEMLRRHFGARSVGSAAVAAVRPPPVPAAVVEARPAPKSRPRRGDAGRVLDLELITDACAMLGVERLRSLLQSFFADESRTLADLLERVDGGQIEGLSASAHRVKGTAATLGLRQLAESARQIEERGLPDEAAQRQEPGIARPRAHQNDLPARTAGVIQFVLENFLRCRLITGMHQAGKAAAKHPLPEATAFRYAGQARFQVVAPVAGFFRHAPEAGRQQRFDFFTQHARQHRCGTAGGDRHQQRRTVNDRRENKRA